MIFMDEPLLVRLFKQGRLLLVNVKEGRGLMYLYAVHVHAYL